MAHSWRTGPRRLTALGAAAFALYAPGADAIVLAEPQVRSALGEPLDARIPVTLGAGESIEPACFTVLREPAGDVPRLESAMVSVERSASGTFLRIRTTSPVSEPALMLGIAASCRGQSGEYKRDFSLLFDPRATAAPRPAPGAITTIREIATTLIARLGDTLESIANAIFPRNRAARKSYIEALRESNPPLAALGDSEPIPLDTPIALPELRSFARSRPAHEPEAQVAAAPVHATPPPAPRAEVAPPAPRAEAAPAPTRRKVAEPKAAAPRAAAPKVVARVPDEQPPRSLKSVAAERGHAAPGFVLKLSSPEVDLSRSRAIDDRLRAQLRERLMVLDADDQVAALLALRNSVRQLESRVAELQLKLSGMPASFPPPRAEPPKPAEAPKPAPPPAVAVAPKVAPPIETPKAIESPKVVEAPKVLEPPKVVEAPKTQVVEAPKVAEAPKAVEKPMAIETPKTVETPKAAETPRIEVPKAAAPPEVFEPRKAGAKPSRFGSESDWLTYALWGVVALLIAAAGLLAWRLARRRKAALEYEEDLFEPPAAAAAAAAPEDDEIVVADEHHPEEIAFAEEAFELMPPSEARREIDADVDLPTRLAENTDDLRRRYIEERFPEINKGAIVLDDPDSVVKGARLFYEDGAVARAVELLQYACERNPGQVKTWLALFEIFRLERLTAEFATLARRFKEHHGKGEFWRKVQYFGREIDPGNTLYQEEPLNTFETIGPSQARRIAAEASFDPVAENWLGAPMDFENEVLVNDLRKALLAEAGVNEEQLAPNPMPALRNVEMFNIA